VIEVTNLQSTRSDIAELRSDDTADLTTLLFYIGDRQNGTNFNTNRYGRYLTSSYAGLDVILDVATDSVFARFFKLVH
jgi:hypothetical protein